MGNIEIYNAPEGESLKKLLSECIFVFDTSSLLYLYYFSNESRNEILNKTLEPIKNRVWIPHHVMYEYQKNREETIKKPLDEKYSEGLKNSILPVKKGINDIENKLKNFTEFTRNSDVHPYLEGDINQKFFEKFLEFKSDFVSYEDEIKKEFKKREAEILALSENDNVLNYIKENLEIGIETKFEDIMKLVEMGEMRYRNKIPPGYEDESKKIGTQKYGDLIIWKEILNHVESEAKSVVFITNDVKLDWCYSIKNGSENRITKPREELVKEFFDNNNSRFWMYTFKQFLHLSQDIMEAHINQNVFVEAASVEAKSIEPINFQLETGLTREAINFVYENIEEIGSLLAIRHTRNKTNIEYFTEIIGRKGKIQIIGGLASGYSGTGPNGFLDLVVKLGVTPPLAEKHIIRNQDRKYSFEISLIQNYSSSSNKYYTNIGQCCTVCGNENWNGVMCMSCGTMSDD